MKIIASAPSNIALIKYMGKSPEGGNVPINASLSYSLDHLTTIVAAEPSQENRLLTVDELPAEKKLSALGIEKFLKHADRMQQALGINQKFSFHTKNNFPSDCGLASSASSFAALTLAMAKVPTADTKVSQDLKALSALSRQGSGSSCRSLYSPWGLWRTDCAEPVASLQTLQFNHLVVIVDSEKKKVSSSEAHQRVNSSLLFNGRRERAESRLNELVLCLESANSAKSWAGAQQIVWEEFWDMHALFETSRPAFSYFTAKTMEVLKQLTPMNSLGEGALVTMDAGPNVHLLYRKQDAKIYQDIAWLKENHFHYLSSLESQ